MDRCLDILPLELKERIAKLVHQLNMDIIHKIIKEQVVWIEHDNKRMFLVSESKNYYQILTLEPECV